MDTLSLLTGLRFVDSFFPSGGYAFSSGLEAAVQGRAVKNADDLDRFVTDQLRNGTGRCEAIAVARAHQASAVSHLPSALEADQELDAMKLCRDTRMASRQMGRQVLKIATEQQKGQQDVATILTDYRAEVEAGRSSGHLAVAFGLTLGACGWSEKDTVAAYLYQSVVGLVSASLRLLPVGQREAQRLLESWLPLIENLSRAKERGPTMASWVPVQDIYAMRHARLNTRLFRS